MSLPWTSPGNWPNRTGDGTATLKAKLLPMSSSVRVRAPMAPFGQAARQEPQSMHSSESTCALPRLTRIA